MFTQNSSSVRTKVFSLLRIGWLKHSSTGSLTFCVFAILLGIALSDSRAMAGEVDSLQKKALVTAKVDSIQGPISNPQRVESFGPDRRKTPGIFDMITNLPDDWYRFAKTSINLDHAPLIGGIALLTAGLIVVDNPTWIPFKKAYEISTPVQRLSDAFVFMGDGKFQFGLAAAFGAYGFIAPLSANQQRALRTASQTAEVILACGAVVQLLKHLTGRESPIVATERNGLWQFFPNQIQYANHVPHYDAFPSGHLATATATLMVITNNYPEVTWLKPVGYLFLAGITTGLVATSIHWWSDFPLGFALGYAFGNLVSPAPEEVGSAVGINQSEAPPTEPKKTLASLLHRALLYPTSVAGSSGIGVTIPF